MPEYDISASLDKLLASPWETVLEENPKFKQATENWGPRTGAGDGFSGGLRAAEGAFERSAVSLRLGHGRAAERSDPRATGAFARRSGGGPWQGG